MGIKAHKHGIGVGTPVQIKHGGLCYYGVVRAMANGQAFVLGICLSYPAPHLESLLTPIDALTAISLEEIESVAQHYCKALHRSSTICSSCHELIHLSGVPI